MSKTATCGVSGKVSIACSIPIAFAGLCNGASSERSLICCSTAVSISTGSPNSDPPCTTRCPTAVSFASESDRPDVSKICCMTRRACGVVGNLRRTLCLDPVLLVHRSGGLVADALDDPRRQRRSGVHIDQLVFHRRRPGIDDQHRLRHRPAPAGEPCAWIAVMATVLTMSATRAPRERSLTGRFKPCSTGPIATAPALRCTAL